MATAAPKETPSPTTVQNLFTVVVEHSDDVESMSNQVQRLITALPSVSRVAILRPDAERRIVANDGSEFRPVMR
jgi:uncharacterized coiled-coil protein SlyX